MTLFQYVVYLYVKTKIKICWKVTLGYRIMWIVVFNATFNNISAISWQSVLFVESFQCTITFSWIYSVLRNQPWYYSVYTMILIIFFIFSETGDISSYDIQYQYNP
jgi:hypothetical protein